MESAVNIAKVIIDYIGGVDVLYATMAALAASHIYMLVAGKNIYDRATRIIPYVAGPIATMSMLGVSWRSLHVGVVCGLVGSLLRFAAFSYLNRKDAPNWQVRIAGVVGGTQNVRDM